jgi:hypothetical protein
VTKALDSITLADVMHDDVLLDEATGG